MDSQHKHELKENDLQQFISHFGEWWGKHQTKVLIIAIVGAALILGVRWMNASATAKHENTYTELNLETSPAGFKAIAANASADSVAAIANLRGADLLLSEAMLPPTGLEDDQTPEQRKAKLKEAHQLYSKVVNSSAHKLLKLNASDGMASVAESLGQWEDATKIYGSIKTDAGEEYQHFANLAAAKLEAQPRAQASVDFAPEPKKPDPDKPDPTKSGDSKSGTPTKTGDATKSGDTKQPTKDAVSPTKDIKSPDKSGGSKQPTKDAASPAKDAKSPEKSGDTKQPTKDAVSPAKSGDGKKAPDTKDGTKSP